jgi:hypothetical protein
MHPEYAMSLFRNACGRREKQAKRECTESLHAD